MSGLVLVCMYFLMCFRQLLLLVCDVYKTTDVTVLLFVRCRCRKTRSARRDRRIRSRRRESDRAAKTHSVTTVSTSLFRTVLEFQCTCTCIELAECKQSTCVLRGTVVVADDVQVERIPFFVEFGKNYFRSDQSPLSRSHESSV